MFPTGPRSLSSMPRPVRSGHHPRWRAADSVGDRSGVGVSYLDGRLIDSDLVTGGFRWFSGPVADLSMLDVGADLPVQAVTTTPGTVYAGTTDGSGDGDALDPYSGEERWRFSTGATGYPLSTPAVLGGMVFVGTGSGVVGDHRERPAASGADPGTERWGGTQRDADRPCG